MPQALSSIKVLFNSIFDAKISQLMGISNKKCLLYPNFYFLNHSLQQNKIKLKPQYFFIQLYINRSLEHRSILLFPRLCFKLLMEFITTEPFKDLIYLLSFSIKYTCQNLCQKSLFAQISSIFVHFIQLWRIDKSFTHYNKINHKQMSENVKVMVRCRPFSVREDSRTNILLIDRDLHQITVSKSKGSAELQKVFTFDHVFGPESTQDQIYQQSAFMLVENVLEGYNGTIFAYGQTGCGKTYTMTGGINEEQRGVIPRTFKQIITRTASQKQKRHLLHCSYIQIYNEEVYDLFDKKNRTKLQVKQVPGKGTIIKDQKLQIVKSLEEVHKLFEMGSKNRAIRETSFNKYSSRSHCIFTIYVESVQQTVQGNELYKSGKLNLVDLAGSERQSKLKMAGVGLKETTRINLSLSALGNVISALVDGRSSHIPYRDSKLTRLLQDSLGGNTQTVMIATISPAQSSYEETLSTLRYASRTKFIKNKPVINEDPKDTLLRQYAEQIKRLKSILQGIDPNLLANGKVNDKNEFMQQNQTNETKKVLDSEQKEQLRKKLQTLQKLLQRQEVEQDASELQKINRLKEKLKQQQWKQQKLLEDKKKRQEQLMSLETNYKSLNQQVDLLRQRFQDLKTKYVQSQQEIKDLRHEYEKQKQQLLGTIRTQELQLSKYRGIVETVMTQKQVEQIVARSKINQEEMTWVITPFMYKQNLLIFPEQTVRSLGQMLKKQKEKVNMFVSENSRKQYLQQARGQSFGRNMTERNTKDSFAHSEFSTKKRNTSLTSLAEPRLSRKSIISNQAPTQGKKPLAPIEQKKKLNIDIGKIKMDILAELNRNKTRKSSEPE